MRRLLRGLGGERLFVVLGGSTLLLLIVTVIVCSLSRSLPEESGVASASISISIVMFISISSVLRREGAEGLLFALIGSFLSGLAAFMVGARFAFDPGLRSYLLSSLILSIFLSLSSILYVMPENPRERKPRLKSALIWAASTLLAVLANFAIIYWLPRLI